MEQGKKEKILIGVIAFQGVVAEATEAFFKAFYDLGKYHSDKYDFFLKVFTKREQFRARNMLTEYALGLDCDYMWQVDDDTVLQPSTFDILLQALKNEPRAGVAGALYVQRDTPHHAVLMQGGVMPGGGWHSEYIPRHEITGGVMDVLVTGGGCFMFRMEPFKGFMKPYFWSDGEVGTDIQICLKMQESGWKVLCCTGHEVGHVGDGQVFYPSNLPHDIVEFNKLRQEITLDACEFLQTDSLGLQDIAARTVGATKKVWEAEPRTNFEEISRYYINEQIPGAAVARGVWYNLCADAGVHALIELNALIHAKEFGEPGWMLDYGCGTAILGRMFAKQGWNVVAMDLPGKTLDFVRESAEGKLVSDHLPRLKTMTILTEEPILPQARFGVVVMMDVVEHLINPRVVLHDVIESIEPGGYLITNAHTCNFKGREDGQPQHLKLISRDEMLEIYRDMGMVQSEYPTILKKEIDYGNSIENSVHRGQPEDQAAQVS